MLLCMPRQEGGLASECQRAKETELLGTKTDHHIGDYRAVESGMRGPIQNLER